VKLPALGLFERSLRLETRSALMCWARTGLLCLILLVLIPIQSLARAGMFSAPGLRFLQEVVWLNLVFITLAGLSYFASAITEEKEEMMLGLLRMTDLNSVAILLGKSTSRLVGALLLLLVQVPFVLLTVTLGGWAFFKSRHPTELCWPTCSLSAIWHCCFRSCSATRQPRPHLPWLF